MHVMFGWATWSAYIPKTLSSLSNTRLKKVCLLLIDDMRKMVHFFGQMTTGSYKQYWHLNKKRESLIWHESWTHMRKFSRMQCGQSCTQSSSYLLFAVNARTIDSQSYSKNNLFLNSFLENVMAILHSSLDLLIDKGRFSWEGMISSHNNHVWQDENSFQTLHSRS